MWQYHGQHRPPFADAPAPGQESVWDYPRPPRLERWPRSIEVHAGSVRIARTHAAWRICETASPPTVYLPPQDVARARLVPAPGRSWCEWKGMAIYWALRDGPDGNAVAWSYPAPRAAYAPIRDHFGFYPARVACVVDGERVRPQPGAFYGGWVTDALAGPFKGAPGTEAW